MRTLVNIRDIQEEVVKQVSCPRCGVASDAVQSHLEFTPKGKILVQKKAVCPEHGYFACTKHIKAVVMYGKDAQIIPHY